MELREQVKNLAIALGFDVAGVAPAEPTRETRFLREWLTRGYAGSMEYLESRLEERMDPRKLSPEFRSVICVGLTYGQLEASDKNRESAGKVSRYAGGEDYHRVIGDRLEALGSAIEALVGHKIVARYYVDTGPVLEKVFAARAGLGWIGKNTCLIDSKLGSYMFLGVLLTDLEIAYDSQEADHCGSCRACIDACPTDAFPEPYVLDATRCISYNTIELKDSIPENLRADQGSWVFGCDVCQEVCPWNLRSRRRTPDDPLGLRSRLAQKSEWERPSLRWLLNLDEETWRQSTKHTALRRAKWRGLLRNALVAAGNSGDAGLIPDIEAHLSGEEILAEHARWALARLKEVGGQAE